MKNPEASPVPRAQEKPKTATYLLLISIPVFWGSAFALSKAVLDEVPPSVAAFLRFGIGAVIMLSLMRLFGRQAIPRENIGRIAFLGLVGVTAYNLLFFWGLAYSRASDGTMIIPTMSPTITAVLAALILKDRLAKRQALGIVLALCGSAVFFLAVGMTGADVSSRLTGDLFFLGAAVCWSIYTLMGKRVLQTVHPFHATAYAMLVGALGIGVAAAPELFRVQWEHLSVGFWATMLYLAVFPTALANWFFYIGVQSIGPSRTAVFMYLVPVSGLFWAWLVFGDLLTTLQVIGSVLLMTGVWLVNKRNGGG